jgi:hypothetical protein
VHVAYGNRAGDETLLHDFRIDRLAAHLLRALRPLERRRFQCGHAAVDEQPVHIAQVPDGHAAAIVPEGDEGRVHRRGDGTGDKQVAIAEVELVVPVVIVVLVVAPAADADRAVDQQHLRMHALVEPLPAARRGNGVLRVVDARAVQHRVVDAHFEVGVRAGERGEGFHAPQRGELVEQQAHLHAAARGAEQLVEHQLAGVVLVEDVGLQVNARGRGADQVDAREHRVGTAIDDHRVVAWLFGRGFGKRACCEVAQGRRLRAFVDCGAFDRRGARCGDDPRTLFALRRRQARARAQRKRAQGKDEAGRQGHGGAIVGERVWRPAMSPGAMPARCAMWTRAKEQKRTEQARRYGVRGVAVACRRTRRRKFTSSVSAQRQLSTP